MWLHDPQPLDARQRIAHNGYDAHAGPRPDIIWSGVGFAVTYMEAKRPEKGSSGGAIVRWHKSVMLISLPVAVLAVTLAAVWLLERSRMPDW